MLESGQTAHPRFETVRLLSEALGLTDDQMQNLIRLSRSGAVVHDRAVSQHLHTASGVLSVVPHALTSFVGRECEIEEIEKALLSGDVRLLTLLGPGGIGKTRLASEVARRLDGAFSGGTRLLLLDSLADGSLVVPALFQAWHITSPKQELTLEHLADLIGDDAVLLVLDNLEHLLEAAPVAPGLLMRCRNLRILATSREPLRVSGEHRFVVEPLQFPGDRGEARSGSSSPTEAEELFNDRARAADHSFDASGNNAEKVAAICRRLDGLPLAIELAAAQLGNRSLDDLASQMELLLPLLVDGPIDQSERLRTMASSLAWGQALLTAEEQRLFRRLSIFRGGFTPEAVDGLCTGAQEHDSQECSSLLRSLSERSVIVREETGSRVRYRLLEVIREYGAELLQESGEHELVAAAHATWFLELAETHERHAWLPVDPDIPALFSEELPNFRSALSWFERTA